ncbi:MAG: hypothetical protein ACI87N_003179, partial [Flavobacteriales bacterium]
MNKQILLLFLLLLMGKNMKAQESTASKQVTIL